MKVVVAIDGSHAALHALREFFELAKEFTETPEVHLVTVVDYAHVPGTLGKAPAGAPDLLASDAETAQAVALELANRLSTNVKGVVLRGHTVDEILRYAAELKAKLIVVGTHGRTGVGRAILGSTCEGMIRHSTLPVLAVRSVK